MLSPEDTVMIVPAWPLLFILEAIFSREIGLIIQKLSIECLLCAREWRCDSKQREKIHEEQHTLLSWTIKVSVLSISI